MLWSRTGQTEAVWVLYVSVRGKWGKISYETGILQTSIWAFLHFYQSSSVSVTFIQEALCSSLGGMNAGYPVLSCYNNKTGHNLHFTRQCQPVTLLDFKQLQQLDQGCWSSFTGSVAAWLHETCYGKNRAAHRVSLHVTDGTMRTNNV